MMLVSHFSVGAVALKSRLRRFAGAGLISLKHEPYRRRFGVTATRHACFIRRCTTFSEMDTHCLLSDACIRR